MHRGHDLTRHPLVLGVLRLLRVESVVADQLLEHDDRGRDEFWATQVKRVADRLQCAAAVLVRGSAGVRFQGV